MNRQFSSAGVWTDPETGDYEVKAEIHLCSQQLPYFILVRYPSGSDPAATPGVIELNIGPITIPQPLTFTSFEDRLESAHASIDVGLRLNAGDLLVIYYVENVAEPTLAPESGNQNRGYRASSAALPRRPFRLLPLL